MSAREREYRVVWQREGMRRCSRTFQRKGSARRWFEMLTGDPHSARCSHTAYVDQPPYCIWADLAERKGWPDALEADHTGTEPPPWAIEPRMESREVGEWVCGAYGEDHSNGCPASATYPLDSEALA